MLEVIDAAEVRERLSMSECIDLMAHAMTAVTRGTVSIPPRLVMPLIDNSGYLGLMPGSVSDPPIYGAKIVSLHPANALEGRPTIQGFVVLFDHRTGIPLAIVDGAQITALRTAAASGLATRMLARPDARTLGLFGYGVQASSHLESMCAVRDIEEVLVWGRSAHKARAFAERHQQLVKARVRPVTDASDAAACDVVCTVTAAAHGVIEGGWLRPGAHVNLVGAHSCTTREADTRLIQRSRVFVDSLASALSEAGDILIPIKEGAIDALHVQGEIGAVILGEIAGRRSEDEITVYKSVGVVTQDLFAANAVLDAKHPG
jgi:ornithine cyclodeaminase/alanine dehydrogenase-like protein (mu-crystallin family)